MTPRKNSDRQKSSAPRFPVNRRAFWVLLLGFAALSSGCSTNLHTKVSGNLDHLSRNITVAILPVGTTEPGQKDAARLLRRDLYASLKQSRFHVLERYVIDSLLKQHGLIEPEDVSKVSPIKLGEILGADAVLASTMTKVKRSYFVLHSSIELGVSATLTDTRTGEILWMADQTETDFDGIGKIPTGIVSALLAPIHLVTNKLNLRRMTQKMTTKLTALVKRPNLAEKEEQFDSPMVASAATQDIRDVKARPVPAVSKAQPEVRRPGRVAKTINPVADPRTVPPTAPEPRPLAQTAFPASAPDTPPTLGLHPASFAGIAPRSQTPREIRRAAFQVPQRHGSATALPQPRPVQVTTNPIEPPAAVKSTIAKQHIRQTAALKPARHAKLPATAKPGFGNRLQTVFYTVQVGAYRTKSLAKNMIGKLSHKGYNAFLTLVKKGRNLLYKVHVEKFTDKKQAYRYGRSFYAREKLDNFVTTLHTG